MPVPPPAAEHYRRQQRLTVAAIRRARLLWSRMGSEFDGTWTTVGPDLFRLVAAGQLAAAQNGAAYIPLSLQALNVDVPADGRVRAAGFAGIANDGRPLGTLLYESVVVAKAGVQGGLTPALALAKGGRWLDMATASLLADAGRGAASVAIAAREGVGWVRMVNPPCCKRCAQLAGKWFKWNQGFRRHPRCDCVHVPAPESIAGSTGTDPRALIASGQVTGLTKAEQSAVRDGADLSQVVNAQRGASGMFTTESTTKRGVAPGVLRPTPEGIYRAARNRAEALQALQRYGYLQPS